MEKDLVGECFLKQLENKRAEYLTNGDTTSKKKKKKVQVAPGRSITAEDVEEALANVPKKNSTEKLKNKRKRNKSSFVVVV